MILKADLFLRSYPVSILKLFLHVGSIKITKNTHFKFGPEPKKMLRPKKYFELLFPKSGAYILTIPADKNSPKSKGNFTKKIKSASII